MFVIDANYILRYLLEDNENMFKEAKNIIENETILILNEVLAEVVYVLDGVYDVPRKDIAKALNIFINMPNIKVYENKNIFYDTFGLYATTSLDYIDCYLCALKKEYKIVTFDKKLQKCLGI